MICYSLGFVTDGSTTKWCDSFSYSNDFFKNSIKQCKKQLESLCNTVDLNDLTWSQNGPSYYLIAFRSPQGCCMVVCDKELDIEQMRSLTHKVFLSNRSLKELIDDFENCIKPDNKIEEINKIKNEIKEDFSNFVESTLMMESDKNVDEALETAIQLRDQLREKYQSKNICTLF